MTRNVYLVKHLQSQCAFSPDYTSPEKTLVPSYLELIWTCESGTAYTFIILIRRQWISYVIKSQQNVSRGLISTITETEA